MTIGAAEFSIGDESLDIVATGRSKSLFSGDIQDRTAELSDAIKGRRILVVGGAGTIGSSTSRLIVNFEPAAIHVIDQSEAYLAEFVRNLRGSPTSVRKNLDLQALPIDYGGKRTERLLREQNVPYDVVLNFAAMKHVRSEKDTVSTLEMLDVNIVRHQAFLEWLHVGNHASRYFAVSTDKAANPTSIMGASKRLMEDLVFARPKEQGATTTSARFANVAFSNGSLLQGFLYRVASKQPVAAPRDTRRYFVSRREAGEICLLAAFCTPSNHVVFPNLDPSRELRPLALIAERFLEHLGYKAELFDDETEAREAVPSCLKRGKWPLLITALDTSGEKPYEEFIGKGEHMVDVGFDSLRAITHVAASGNSAGAITDLARYCSDPTVLVKKADIVRILTRSVGSFQHIETGINLDQRL